MRTYGVLLFLTEKCNASCSYCYQINKRHKDMKIEDAIKIIEKARTSKYFNNSIDFFGGEPTLNMELIRTIMDKYPNMKYNITTNGNFINLKESDMQYINRINKIEISIETNEHDSRTMRKIPNLLNFIDEQVDHFMNNTKAELWFNIVANVYNINNEFETIMNKLLDYYDIYKERFFVKIFPMVDSNVVVGDFDTNQDWFDFIYKYKHTNKRLYKLLLSYYDNVLTDFNIVNDGMICEYDELASFNVDGDMVHCTHYYNNPILNYKDITESKDLDYTINVMNKEHVDKCKSVKEEICNCKDCAITNMFHCYVCRRTVDIAIKTGDYSDMKKLCDRSQLRYAMILELLSEEEQPLQIYRGNT